mmetsp:Transcript_31068/g.41460  ORF Transcript_31068/g.41460 Transcript_31068/m.41460 type:complete len:562 (-) Transcript_31068:677-2362(-)
MTATPTNSTKGESSNNGDTDSSSSSVLVLYKISNSTTDSSSNEYNAFQIPKQSSRDTSGKKVMTLSHVKQHLTPLFRTLNGEEGCDGYHWRVLASNSTAGEMGWYDATKESDYLPFQSVTGGELQRLLYSTSSSNSSSETSTNEPKMDVLVLKLLDLAKIHFDQCQKKLLKKKMQQKKKMNNNSVVTTRSSGPSLLSSLTAPVDNNTNDGDNNESVPQKREEKSSSEEKKEEEILVTPTKPSMEDHPLAFACKPAMRESILSSLQKEQEQDVSSVEIKKEIVSTASTPTAGYRNQRYFSDATSVSEAVEVVLSKSTPTVKKELSSKKHKSRNTVTAKTDIVAKGQNEFECVLTNSPVRYHPPAAKADKKKNKTPSSPSYHKRHSNTSTIGTHSKKTQEINVRKTSPTASPTNYYKRNPHRGSTKAWSNARSNSPCSIADFADAVPTTTPPASYSNVKQMQKLRMPNIDVPVFNVNQSPPPLCPHQGWEDTLGFTNAATLTPPRQEQQSSPVRKLSWEEAIQGHSSAPPTVQDLLFPTAGNTYQHQQPQSLTPFIPSSHCMV